MGLGVDSSSDAKDRNSCRGAVMTVWRVDRRRSTSCENDQGFEDMYPIIGRSNTCDMASGCSRVLPAFLPAEPSLAPQSLSDWSLWIGALGWAGDVNLKITAT